MADRDIAVTIIVYISKSREYHSPVIIQFVYASQDRHYNFFLWAAHLYKMPLNPLLWGPGMPCVNSMRITESLRQRSKQSFVIKIVKIKKLL